MAFFISLFIYFFISLFLISIFSCNKEEYSIKKTETQQTIETRLTTIEDGVIDYDDPNIITEDNLALLKVITESYPSKENSNFNFRLSKITATNVVKHQSNNKSVYSLFLNEDYEHSIFNLIIKIDNDDKVLDQYILRYKMDPVFANNYYSGDTPFSEFQGVLQTFQSDAIFSLQKRTNCIDDLTCCEISSGGGGGNGGSGGNGGNSGSGGSGGSGGNPDVANCEYGKWCRPCANRCEGECHASCTCTPPSITWTGWVCQFPLQNEDNIIYRTSDCCRDENDEIPMNPGIDPSTVRDEDVPTDFTEELQTGLNSSNFLNNFLEGNTSLTQSDIIDAAECADCRLYPANSTFAPSNNYNQCVLTQILTDAPCGGALTDFMDYYSLTLTPAQQLNLVGPGGITSSCGENSNFPEQAINILCELYEFCPNSITEVVLQNGDPFATSTMPPCPNLFEFTFIGNGMTPFDPLDDNPTTQEAGLTNLNLTLNIPSSNGESTTTFFIPSLYFTVGESSLNCGEGYSHSESASTAIQQAMLWVENEVNNNGMPPELARTALLGQIGNFFREIITEAGCLTEGGAYTIQVGTNETDMFASNDRHKNTIFTDFEENFESVCQ